jgi:hypothetical protein
MKILILVWGTLIQTVRQWELEKHLEKYHGCAPSTPVLFLEYAQQQDPLLEVREVRILLIFFEDSFYSLKERDKPFSRIMFIHFGIFKKSLISSTVSRIRVQLPLQKLPTKKGRAKKFYVLMKRFSLELESLRVGEIDYIFQTKY